jgi:NTE family protein
MPTTRRTAPTRTSAPRTAAPRTAPSPAPLPAPRTGLDRIDLALQGGGSHGAFTWGVLDRLLEDETLEFGGISGTSAGAMNAVALADGLMDGGREGARASLRRFWTRVGQIAPFTPLPATALALPGMPGIPGLPWPMLPPAFAPWLAFWGDAWGAVLRSASPYVVNPLNLNPLRGILEETVDFERVRRCHKTALFIAATRVRTGELRVFRQDELTADMVLASACLPLLFQTVNVGDEPYWDGGYAGNPSLLPLVADRGTDDLLLVQINPARRDEVPTAAGDIMERVGEITFNASLLKELRMIGLMRTLADAFEGPVASPAVQGVVQRLQRLRLHRIDGGQVLAAFGADTKTNTGALFLQRLFELGRQSAQDWLAAHRGDIGRRGSLPTPRP